MLRNILYEAPWGPWNGPFSGGPWSKFWVQHAGNQTLRTFGFLQLLLIQIGPRLIKLNNCWNPPFLDASSYARWCDLCLSLKWIEKSVPTLLGTIKMTKRSGGADVGTYLPTYLWCMPSNVGYESVRRPVHRKWCIAHSTLFWLAITSTHIAFEIWWWWECCLVHLGGRVQTDRIFKQFAE